MDVGIGSWKDSSYGTTVATIASHYFISIDRHWALINVLFIICMCSNNGCSCSLL